MNYSNNIEQEPLNVPNATQTQYIYTLLYTLTKQINNGTGVVTQYSKNYKLRKFQTHEDSLKKKRST